MPKQLCHRHPRFRLRQVRQDILNIFREQQNFQAEIDRMFDTSLHRVEMRYLPAVWLHDAMARFVRFIAGATIQQTRGRVAQVDDENNTFSYNPVYWDDIVHGGFDALVHEAVHLTELQVNLSNQMHEGRRVLGRLNLDVETASRRDLQSNTEFQKADCVFGCSGRFRREVQAYSCTNGLQRRANYFRGRIPPAPSKGGSGRPAYRLSAGLPSLTLKVRSTGGFKEQVLNNLVKEFPNLVRLLAPDDEMEVFDAVRARTAPVGRRIPPFL